MFCHSDPFIYRRMVSKIQSVTKADAARAAAKHLSAFTRVGESVISAACYGADNSKAVADEFARPSQKEAKVDFTVLDDIENSVYAI